MKKNKSTFVELLKRIKKHSFFIILSLIMAAVTVATTLYVPILISIFTIFAKSTLFTPIMQSIPRPTRIGT